MIVQTYGEALDEVQDEFDLKGETIIAADEYVSFFNRGVQKAAAEIYTLGVEDEYFTDEAPLTMVQGVADIAIPANIYAHKIRFIIHNDGTDKYTVSRIRRKDRGLGEALINSEETDRNYQYRIKNTGTAAGAKIHLVPPARVSSAAILTAHFWREAERIPLVSAGSLALTRAAKIDLPECRTFIHSYVMWRVAKKLMHPNQADYKMDMLEELELMRATLTGQADDDDTTAEADFSHYRETS